MDIAAITKQAKEMLLETKTQMPTFFVEFQGGDIQMIVLDHLEDTTAKKEKQFFLMARGLAQKGGWKAESLKEIIFLVEAWMSNATVGKKRKYDRPADDPNRKEVLVVTRLSVMPQPDGKPKLQDTVHYVEMLRDGSGDLVDLLSDTQEIGEVHNYLLRAFLAGVASTEFSEAQLVKLAMSRGRGE